MSQFYKLTKEETLKKLQVEEKIGLKQINIDLRQKKHGLNEITHEKKNLTSKNILPAIH